MSSNIASDRLLLIFPGCSSQVHLAKFWIIIFFPVQLLREELRSAICKWEACARGAWVENNRYAGSFGFSNLAGWEAVCVLFVCRRLLHIPFLLQKSAWMHLTECNIKFSFFFRWSSHNSTFWQWFLIIDSERVIPGFPSPQKAASQAFIISHFTGFRRPGAFTAFWTTCKNRKL